MKSLVTSLVLLISVLGYSQSTDSVKLATNEETKFENLGITITVNSVEGIEKHVKIDEIKKILDMSSDNQSVYFSIKCNGETNPKGVKSHMSYKIRGNSNDSESFLKGVKKLRTSAIKFYNNKN